MSLTEKQKYILLFLLTIFLVALAFWLSLLFAEEYFFDRVAYAKSARYGYVHNLENPMVNSDNPYFIEKRLQDLRLVFPTVFSDKNFISSSPKKREEKPDGYTVLVVGDSIVYGNGVLPEERFPVLLEKMLDEHRPTQVFSLAQSGDSIVDNYYKFSVAQTTIEPDVTIFGMVNNDLILDMVNKYPLQSSFYRNLRKRCPKPEKRYNWESGELSSAEAMEEVFWPSVSDKYANICYLDKIAKLLHEQPVMFFSSVPLYPETSEKENTEGWYAWKIMDRYSQVLRDNGIYVFSPLNLGEFEYEPVSARENHPNPATHREYAKSITHELLENPRWGFK